MEVILPYTKDVSHDNSQNSRIPGYPGRDRVSRDETTPNSDTYAVKIPMDSTRTHRQSKYQWTVLGHDSKIVDQNRKERGYGDTFIFETLV